MTNKFLAVAALSAISALAQGSGTQRQQPTPEQMVERRVERLTTLLNLTASQQTQLKTIFTEEATAQTALRPQREAAQTELKDSVENNLPEPQIERVAQQVGTVHGQMVAIQAKAQAKFLNALTKEQRDKLQALPQGPGMGGPGRGPGGPGGMGPRGGSSRY
jgi:Spy/CpxP family protein refolding chaperone